MAVTSEQVRAILDRDEPDYEEAAKLGAEALPHLRKFVESGDPNRASKAAYLAGRIGDAEAADILQVAAASDETVIRVAAAGGAAHLPDQVADELLQTLVDDDDVSVRKVALKSVPDKPSKKLADKLKVLREHEPEPSLRDLADAALEKGGGG